MVRWSPDRLLARGTFMPVDDFLVIPQVPPNFPPLAGETVQDQYMSQTFGKAAAVIDLRAFNLSSGNPATIGATSTGAGAGQVTFNPLVVEKVVDGTSPSLFVISAQGLHFPTIQIFVRKAGTSPQQDKPFLAYEFGTVFITELAWSEGGGEDVPIETVTFAYGALTVGYYPQKPDGSFGPPGKLGWSQITNTQTTGNLLQGF